MNVVMIGDEPGMAEFAAETGIQHLPDVDQKSVRYTAGELDFLRGSSDQHLPVAGICQRRYPAHPSIRYRCQPGILPG